MTADVLSDVLRAVRLTGAMHFDFELRSPWVAETPPSREIAAQVMPGSQRVMEYHIVANGRCWAHAVGHAPVRLEEGDLIVFPQGDAHVLASEPGLRKSPDLSLFARGPTPLPVYYEVGGGGPERVRILCGFLGCDEHPFNPLLATLPTMIHVSSSASGQGGWLAMLAAIAAQESRSPRAGSGNTLARVSELLFVEAVRQYLESLPAGHSGWLAGLRDPLVGRALAALHAAPAEPWTVERLARHVAVSRSVLAERFADLVGQPPMQYLTLWRMQMASRLLIDGGHVAAVAEAVGYESEAAFSRAFKRRLGESPATWRDGQRRGPATGGRAPRARRPDHPSMGR